MRFNSEVLIKIDTVAAMASGVKLYEGEAGAILCNGRVSPECFVWVEMTDNGSIIWERARATTADESDEDVDQGSSSALPSGTQNPAPAAGRQVDGSQRPVSPQKVQTPKSAVPVKAPPQASSGIPVKAPPQQMSGIPTKAPPQASSGQPLWKPSMPKPSSVAKALTPQPVFSAVQGSSSSSSNQVPIKAMPSSAFPPKEEYPGQELDVLLSFLNPTSKHSSPALPVEIGSNVVKDESEVLAEKLTKRSWNKDEFDLPVKAAKYLPIEMIVDLEADSDVEESIKALIPGATGSGAQASANTPEEFFVGDMPGEEIPTAESTADFGTGQQQPGAGRRQPDTWNFDFSHVEFNDDQAEISARRFQNAYGVEVDWVKRSRGKKSQAAFMVRRLATYDKIARKPKHGYTGYEDRFDKDAVFRRRMLEKGYGPDFRHMVETVYAPRKGPATGGGNRGRGKGRGGKRDRDDVQDSGPRAWPRAAGWVAGATWASSWSGAAGTEVVLYNGNAHAVVTRESILSEVVAYMDFVDTAYYKVMLILVFLAFMLLFFLACIFHRAQRHQDGLTPTIRRWARLLVHAWRVRFRLSIWAFLGQYMQQLDPAFSHHLRTVYLPPSGIPPRMSRRLKKLGEK